LLATPGESSDAVSEEEEPGWSPYLRFALPALGILIVVRVAPTAPAEYYAERARTILTDWHRFVSPEQDIQLEALARRGLEWDPRNPELYVALAEAQIVQGDLSTEAPVQQKLYAQAVESYRKALEYAPRNVGYVLGLASVLDQAERFAEAEPILARALELDPNSGVTHTVIANHLVVQGKLDEAAAQYQLGFQLGAWQGGQAGLQYIKQQKEKQLQKDAPAPAGPPEKPQ
jgi:tetratricopeptide (TPR) repeat protein